MQANRILYLDPQYCLPPKQRLKRKGALNGFFKLDAFITFHEIITTALTFVSLLVAHFAIFDRRPCKTIFTIHANLAKNIFCALCAISIDN